MRVSFIVPVFNNLPLALDCLRSLRETVGGVSHEIVVVDDGSGPETAAGLRALDWPELRLIPLSGNRGYAHANNRGAIEARGEILFLLNSDLVLQPGWLEPMLAAFERFPEVGLVGNLQRAVATGALDHAGSFFDADATLVHRRRPNRKRFREPEFTPYQAITGACCAILRERFLRLGGFDEAFVNGAEDTDLALRLQAHGHHAVVANRSVVLHHISASRGPRGASEERNFRLLQRRWQETIARAAARRWPIHYLSQVARDPRLIAVRPDRFWEALSRRLRPKRAPSPTGFALASCHLERRERHWRALLDGFSDEEIKAADRAANPHWRRDSYLFEDFQPSKAGRDGVWLRKAGRFHLPRGIHATDVAVSGAIHAADPAIPQERGQLGLRLTVNDLETRLFYPLPEGPFSATLDNAPDRAGEPLEIEARLVGIGGANFRALLGRKLSRWAFLPKTLRDALGSYRPQLLNQRLAIHRLEVNGEEVFDFARDPASPLNAAFALRHAEFGINLVGWFKAQLGIGESARLAAKALQSSDIPHRLCALKVNCTAEQGEDAYDAFLSEENPFPVNVFHIDAPQCGDIDHHHGAAFRRGRYNIAYWAWELPEFPDRWTRFFQYFDEIWAPSDFAREAIAMKSPVPVLTMPHCIDFALPERDYRAALGLPKDAFLFSFAYDLNSYQERKNPRAVIEAFKLAFAGADRRDDVALVIKTHATANNPASHRELLELLKGVPRYYFIDRTLSREMTYGLMQASDCYVSLHRAEGFGLTVAESMYLGKPVISTDWSATAEFVNRDNGCPVRAELARLPRNYGPYDKGQFWAEPDIEDAASHMLRLAGDPELCQRLGARAALTIREKFSPQRIASLYNRRLRSIALW